MFVLMCVLAGAFKQQYTPKVPAVVPQQIVEGPLVTVVLPDPLPVEPAAEKPIPQPAPTKQHAPPKQTAANGIDLDGKRMLSVKASAYTGSAGENGGYADLDRTGKPLKIGTISVDPRVIPIGSTVYITGYTDSRLPAGGMIAHATDTGSAIKGNKIDIFIPGTNKSVSTFGIQNVKLYILN